MGIALLLHVLSVVIWVGGMFFAYVVLRPVAATQLEPPLRLRLWVAIFNRFFPWVWACITTLLATGFWMIVNGLGGFAAIGLYVNIMMVLGLVMMMIFLHVFFAPFKRLKNAVTDSDWQLGGQKLAQIRTLVGLNTILGFVTLIVAIAGKYYLV